MSLRRTGRVIVVGSINMDLTFRCGRFPNPGETLLGGDFARFPGGKGANQAVAASRMGAVTTIVGAVGDDPFGAEMRAFLQAEGVEVSGLGVHAGEATGVAAIFVASGENMIVVAEGANARLDLGACGIAPTAADIVVAQLEIPVDAVAAALAQAKAAGAYTLLNAAPARPEAARLLPDCNCVVLNEGELALLAGRGPAPSPAQGEIQDGALLDAIGALRSRADQVFVVTLGSRGVFAAGPQGPMRLPAHAVPVIDSTGAGDCFVGTLAAELLAGSRLPTALACANAAAALSVGRAGAASSLPRRAEVAAFLTSLEPQA